ncbi:MAG: hypothetical protein AAB605_00055 [Patescibacteria group bacterium]
MLIVALVPQQWWQSDLTSSDTSTSTLFVTLRSPSGVIKKWTVTRPQSELALSDARVALGDIFSIHKKNGEYHVAIRLDGIKGTLRVQSSVKPFAVSEFGTLPMWLLYMLSLKRAPISYVSFVPRDRAWVELEVENREIKQEATAYHEQGRFDGTAHDLSREGWIWFHIFGEEWGVFGAENAYIYITGDDTLIRHGYPMRKETFTLTRKQYWQYDKRVLQAATLDFKIPEISLTAIFEPTNEENLIHYSSSDSRELWSTRYTTARVSIEYSGKTYSFSSPALLETCRYKCNVLTAH